MTGWNSATRQWLIRWGMYSWGFAVLCILNGVFLIVAAKSPFVYVLGGFGLGIGVMLLCVGRLMVLLLKAIRLEQEKRGERW